MGTKLPLLLLLSVLFSSMASSLAYSVDDNTGGSGQWQQKQLQQCMKSCSSQGQSPMQCQKSCLQKISGQGGSMDDIYPMIDPSQGQQQQLQRITQECQQYCQRQTQMPAQQMQCTQSCVSQQLQQGGGGRSILVSSRQGQQQQDIYQQCKKMCQAQQRQGQQGQSLTQCELECIGQQMQQGGGGSGGRSGIWATLDSSGQGQQQQGVYGQCEKMCEGHPGQSRIQCRSQCRQLQMGSGGGRHRGPVSPYSLGDPRCQMQCGKYQPLSEEWQMCQSSCKQQLQYGQESFNEMEIGSRGSSGQSFDHCQRSCRSMCGGPGGQGMGTQQLQCMGCMMDCMGGQQQGYNGKQVGFSGSFLDE